MNAANEDRVVRIKNGVKGRVVEAQGPQLRIALGGDCGIIWVGVDQVAEWNVIW
jgi:hypothetical protein